MLQKIKPEVYWYTIREDVEKFVSEVRVLQKLSFILTGWYVIEFRYFQIGKCGACQIQGHGLLKIRDDIRQISVPSSAWRLVGMDLITMKPTSSQNKYILTLIDYFSKWPEAIPLHNKEAVTVAKALHKHVYCRYGAPVRIITDNGTEFKNEVCKVCTALQFTY